MVNSNQQTNSFQYFIWHNIFLRLGMIGLLEEINEFHSPLLATAIHDGHNLRPGISRYVAIDEYERLREEDPYTGFLTEISESRIIVDTSRFEVDVNRPREGSVYRTPDQSWGIKVWKDNVPVSVWEYSYGEYDFFYSRLERLISSCLEFKHPFVRLRRLFLLLALIFFILHFRLLNFEVIMYKNSVKWKEGK